MAAVKHSHHDIELDAEGTDSARLAQAGAQQVAVVSPARWGIRHEIAPGGQEPPLARGHRRAGASGLRAGRGLQARRHSENRGTAHGRRARTSRWRGAIHLSSLSRPTIWSMRSPCPVFALDDIAFHCGIHPVGCGSHQLESSLMRFSAGLAFPSPRARRTSLGPRSTPSGGERSGRYGRGARYPRPRLHPARGRQSCSPVTARAS